MLKFKIASGFKIKRGITPRQIRQLIDFSNKDPEVLSFTSDKERFSTIAKYANWHKEGEKSLYTLVDSYSNLLGLIWFGKKDMPQVGYPKGFKKEKYGITFAIRTYGVARGKGLGLWFMKKAMAMFKKTDKYKTKKRRIWLKVSVKNIPAIKIYKRFGFKKVFGPDREGKVLMAIPTKR